MNELPPRRWFIRRIEDLLGMFFWSVFEEKDFPEKNRYAACWIPVVEASAYDVLKADHARLLGVLEKIAEAERMGYGTQRTCGEMARVAIEGK